MCGIQSHCFFMPTRSPAAAQSSTSVMGKRILLPLAAKAISIYIETTEDESKLQARRNATTDYLWDLFPTDACTNVSWDSPSVALSVSMERSGKSSQTFLYFSAAGSIAHMMS